MTPSSQQMGEPREASRALDERALDQLFRQARSHNGWQAQPVGDELLLRLYDLVKMGPTSLNCCPARFIFVRTRANKERLRRALSPANVSKVMLAPVVVIIGYDLEFHTHLPRLFQHRPEAGRPFEDNAALAQETAFRNGTLQGAYLMLAARSLGLDCGPLSGFDVEQVTREFFAGTRIRVNFLCCLGYGEPRLLFPKLPRFEFSEVCTLA